MRRTDEGEIMDSAFHNTSSAASSTVLNRGFMSKAYATAAIMLGIALGGGNARADIVVGPGFGTPCAEGGCPVFGSSVNAIGAHSLDLFQTSPGPVDTSS